MTFDPKTEYQSTAVAEAYDRRRFSSVAGRVFQWAERRALRRITRMLPTGSRILDAPCGTGRLLSLFLDHHIAPIGADISAEMLAVARRRAREWNGRVSFARMDFARIPLADRSLTAIFSIRFLPHFAPEERVSMLREFRRVSRGWVVVSLSLSSPWHRLRRWIKSGLGHQRPVRHPLTSRALREELRRAGLREIRRFHTFPVLSEQILVICECEPVP